MKILYAIQGTGNGHVSRAREILPALQKEHEVDILISGIQADVRLPYDVKYYFHGMSFIFGKKGNVDVAATYKKSRIRRLLKDIASLPVKEYDLVINDFEPVSAWACYLAGKPCISLSHQCAVLNKNAPQPKNQDVIGKAILKSYAPVTAKYGFHFANYDDNIFTPVIRSEVRNKRSTNLGHYTVYLPAYDDKRIIKILSQIDHIRWEVFSKHSDKSYVTGNISVKPVMNAEFTESMASSVGVLCGAGFETPAEALFLKKKLLVIPMKGQYEQQCNAAALKALGVPVIKSLKKKNLQKIINWAATNEPVRVEYPDITEEIIQRIIRKHANEEIVEPKPVTGFSVKAFKDYSFRRIIKQTAG